MDVTGERYLPGLDWPEISYEHWHRYLWVAHFVAERNVLDIACGEGYGSHILASCARRVVGVDIDAETIAHASATYQLDNLTFRVGSAHTIPINENSSLDVVVSFETIEHLTAEQQTLFIKEAKRVLTPEGLLIVSTPDKRYYSDAPSYKNEFHIHEMYTEEFVQLLGQSFKYTYLLGQKVFPTSHIWPLQSADTGIEELQLQYADGHFVPSSADNKHALFVIAICCDAPLEPTHISLLLDTSGEVIYRTKHAVAETEQMLLKQRQDTALLQGIVVQQETQLTKDAQDIAQLQSLVRACDEQLTKDAQDIALLQAYVASRDTQLAKDAQDIALLQGLVTERDTQLAKDAQDIALLQGLVTERDTQLAKDAQDITLLQGLVSARDLQLAKDAQDITLLQGIVVEHDTQLSRQTEQLAKDAHDIAILQGMVVERDAQLAKDAQDIATLSTQVASLRQELAQIKTSIGGRVLLQGWKLRQNLMPSSGVLVKGGRLTIRTARMLRQRGPHETLRHSVGWVRYKRQQMRGQPVPLPPVALPAQSDEQATYTYQDWIAENEPDVDALRLQHQQAHQLTQQPVISLLVLMPETISATAIAATLTSLHAQTYGCWELWFVAHTATGADLRAVIETVAAHDERVHLLLVDEQLDVAGRMNAVLPHLVGAFVGLLPVGDQLAAHALFAVVSCLNTDFHIDVVYSDSDRIDMAGRRSQPFFKPNWSPTLLLSLNYLTGLGVVRTELLQTLGGADLEAGTAWEWDLALRISEHTGQIRHLPHVLYHARLGVTPSLEMFEDRRTVVRRSLERRGLIADVVYRTGIIQARWQIPTKPLISIVVPSRNLALADRCLRSINDHTRYRHFEIIVVDTTIDGAIAAHYTDDRALQPTVIRYTEPFNYSLVNNLAAQQAHGEVLLFLNDDIEASDDEWLEEMTRWAIRDEIGVVGARLLRANGSIQHAGVVIGMQGFAGHPFDGNFAEEQTIFGSAEWYRNYSAVTGACLMIRRDLFVQVGGFDEQMVLCGSDVELCLRVIEAGHQVVYTPFARLYHLESATRGDSLIPVMDFAYSYVAYLSLLETGDPYFNPNLSLWSSRPSLRRRTDPESLAHVRASLKQLGVTERVEALLQEQRADVQAP